MKPETILAWNRHDVPPAPEREKTTTWSEFVKSHMEVLAATNFFTTEVWTKGGLVTYHVLFFIHLARGKFTLPASRRTRTKTG